MFQTPDQLPSVNMEIVDVKENVPSPFGCTTFCSMNSRCLLTCWKDGQCEMFFAVVSKRYDPSALSGAKESKGTCYSRWIFNKDWTLTIKRLTASSFGSNHQIDEAVDGIFIQGTDFYYHSTSHDSDPWYLVELEETQWIETILILPRSFSTHFKNVLIEVGLTESTMKTFATYGSTLAPANQVIELKGNPIRGKFIKIRKQNERWLVIVEITILGS